LVVGEEFEPNEAFQVLGSGSKGGLLAHESQAAQAPESDLILQLGEEGFDLSALVLRTGASHGRTMLEVAPAKQDWGFQRAKSAAISRREISGTTVLVRDCTALLHPESVRGYGAGD